MKVIGMGNALVDILIKLKSDNTLHELGFPRGSMQLVDKKRSNEVLAKVSGLDVSQSSGGSAANTIHGLAKLGITTGFIGKVGNDELGNFFADDLKAANIKNHLNNSKTESGRAITLISPDSERTFATYLGAAVELSANDIKADNFKGYNILHIEGYLVQNHDLILNAVKLAKECGLEVSLDLASFNVVEENLEFLKSIVGNYVDIVFANEEEAKSFTKKMPEEAIKELSKVCKVAVVKIGKEGSLIWANNEIVKVGVINAEPVDTTGAGDLYAAGFLYGYIKKKAPSECGWYGAILSGNVIEEVGAKMSDSRWENVLKQIKNHK
ncbi:MAG: adenosine kinase [Salinivirgaceae bacterium]|jgi:sugar/nucleoside kinase (ribokinase family)|nr:adenosine kinase [Bacteroidales bacterium]